MRRWGVLVVLVILGSATRSWAPLYRARLTQDCAALGRAVGTITQSQISCLAKPNLLGTFFADVNSASCFAGRMIAGNSSNNWSIVSSNTTTQKLFLTETGDGVNGALPVFGAIAAGDLPAHNLLGAQHGDTVAGSPPTKGDLIVGNQNSLWEKRKVGTDQQVVMSGERTGTGNVTTSGGPPDVTVTGVTSLGAATIFQTEVQIGDTITLYDHTGATQSSTVSNITSNTVLTVSPGFNPRLTSVGFSINSRFSLQWQNRGGPEMFFYRQVGQVYLAGGVTLIRASVADGGPSIPASTNRVGNGTPVLTYVPFLASRRAQISTVSYDLTTNGAAGARCRIGVWDSDNPATGSIRPRHKLYGEVNSSTDADVTSGACPLAQGVGTCTAGDSVKLGSSCTANGDCCSGSCTCTPNCCAQATEAFCTISRNLSTPVTLLPGQLYWIGIQCNANKICSLGAGVTESAGKSCNSDSDCIKPPPGGACTGCCVGAVTSPTIRALSPGASWPIAGYDSNTELGFNQLFEYATPYTSALPNLVGPVGTEVFYKGGPLPELGVVLQ